eukprot:COSAG04_NODE_647_length_11596_cov_18.199878_4_plen_301_part_00
MRTIHEAAVEHGQVAHHFRDEALLRAHHPVREGEHLAALHVHTVVHHDAVRAALLVDESGVHIRNLNRQQGRKLLVEEDLAPICRSRSVKTTPRGRSVLRVHSGRLVARTRASSFDSLRTTARQAAAPSELYVSDTRKASATTPCPTGATVNDTTPPALDAPGTTVLSPAPAAGEIACVQRREMGLGRTCVGDLIRHGRPRWLSRERPPVVIGLGPLQLQLRPRPRPWLRLRLLRLERLRLRLRHRHRLRLPLRFPPPPPRSCSRRLPNVYRHRHPRTWRCRGTGKWALQCPVTCAGCAL